MDNFLEAASNFFGNALIKSLIVLGVVCLLCEVAHLFNNSFSLVEVCVTLGSALAIHLALDFIQNYLELWMHYTRRK